MPGPEHARLASRSTTTTPPCTFVPHPIEHVEATVPREVDTLKILLPNEETFVITHQPRKPRR
jgi:hypothetical protein